MLELKGNQIIVSKNHPYFTLIRTFLQDKTKNPDILVLGPNIVMDIVKYLSDHNDGTVSCLLLALELVKLYLEWKQEPDLKKYETEYQKLFEDCKHGGLIIVFDNDKVSKKPLVFTYKKDATDCFTEITKVIKKKLPHQNKPTDKPKSADPGAAVKQQSASPIIQKIEGFTDYFNEALEFIKQFAEQEVTYSYDNKIQKYFNGVNKAAFSYIRNALGLKTKENNLDTIVAQAAPFEEQKVLAGSIKEVMQMLQIDQDKPRVTFTGIVRAIENNRNLAPKENKGAEFISNVANFLESGQTKLAERKENKGAYEEMLLAKTVTSRAIAQLAATAELDQKRIGGQGGWLWGLFRHPFQYYRNWQARNLVAELRDIQHTSRNDRKGTNVQLLQKTALKYILYVQELYTQTQSKGLLVTDKKLQQEFLARYQELTGYYEFLKVQLKDQKGFSTAMSRENSDVTKKIKEVRTKLNIAIDKLMDAHTKMEMAMHKKCLDNNPEIARTLSAN